MTKMKVSRYNVEDILRLILTTCVLLCILNGVSCQDVWGDVQQVPIAVAQEPAVADQDTQLESQQELAPVPTPAEAIKVSIESNDASMVITPRVTSGRVIPVNMAQVFFVLIIGMAGIKLVLVMAEKVGQKGSKK